MAETDITDAFVDSLFKRIPTGMSQSFTAEQLDALRQAFAQSRHTVDIRRTIPLFGKRYYFVLMLGPERRPRQRLLGARASHPAWTIGNIIVFVLLGTMLAHTLVQVLRSFTMLLSGKL